MRKTARCSASLGYVVWLDAPLAVILERTGKSRHRPLLHTDDPAAKIRELMERRGPLYQETAHLKLDTAGLDSGEIATGILECARYFFTQRAVMNGVEAQIKAWAAELGFDDCRIARAAEAAHAEVFRDWLAEGKHGGMAWLERAPERRCDPREVLPGCTSLICLAMNYYPGSDSVSGRSSRRLSHRPLCVE